MKINLQNIENLILENSKLMISLNFPTQYDQWKLSKRTNLNYLCKQSLLRILNALDDKRIGILKKHFGEEIEIEKIDNSLVKNRTHHIDDELTGQKFENFCVYRKGTELSITYWK